jgi:formiminotetrahydrofolate cyclodeaminase
MEWVIDNGNKNFVEEFQNVFKFKKPGIKSQFFNVIVKNLDLTDDEKVEYEAYIRSQVAGSLPANLKMVNIIWR